LTFRDGNVGTATVTGAEAQAAANTIFEDAGANAGNGFLGEGGSAYIVINTSGPFTSVTATNAAVSSSNRPSFEFAGVAAAQTPFIPNVPEPSSFALALSGLALGVIYGSRRPKRPSAPA